MPRSSRPRKAYRPRMVDAPVLDGLVEMFAGTLRDAEIGLRLRAETPEHFDAIATALNTVGPVALRRLARHSPEAIALRSAALAMNAAADRAAAGHPKMDDHEIECVARGIDACKAALPGLSVRDLYLQRQAVARVHTEARP